MDVFVENLIFGITENSVFDLEDGWGDRFGLGESKVNRLFHLNFLYDFHLFQFLHTALSHRGSTVVGTEFSDNSFVFCDLVLLFFIFFHVLFYILVSCFFKLVVITLVIKKLLFEKMDRVCANVVKEFPRMRNNHESAFTVLNVVFEPKNGFYI